MRTRPKWYMRDRDPFGATATFPTMVLAGAESQGAVEPTLALGNQVQPCWRARHPNRRHAVLRGDAGRVLTTPSILFALNCIAQFVVTRVDHAGHRNLRARPGSWVDDGCPERLSAPLV